MRRALFASLLGAGLALACGGNKADEKAPSEAAAKTDEKAAENTDEAADEKSATKIEPAGPLTEEEQRLIDADPASLSPEERRARGYALRKKIMQNPDSEAARAIREGVEAIERGEVEVPPHLLRDGAQTQGSGSGPMLSAPTANNGSSAPQDTPLK